jgi:hypothetical protein
MAVLYYFWKSGASHGSAVYMCSSHIFGGACAVPFKVFSAPIANECTRVLTARESWTPSGSQTGAMLYPYVCVIHRMGSWETRTDIVRYSYGNFENSTGAVRFEEGKPRRSQDGHAPLRTPCDFANLPRNVGPYGRRIMNRWIFDLGITCQIYRRFRLVTRNYITNTSVGTWGARAGVHRVVSRSRGLEQSSVSLILSSSLIKVLH